MAGDPGEERVQVGGAATYNRASGGVDGVSEQSVGAGGGKKYHHVPLPSRTAVQ